MTWGTLLNAGLTFACLLREQPAPIVPCSHVKPLSAFSWWRFSCVFAARVQVAQVSHRQAITLR